MSCLIWLNLDSIISISSSLLFYYIFIINYHSLNTQNFTYNRYIDIDKIQKRERYVIRKILGQCSQVYEIFLGLIK